MHRHEYDRKTYVLNMRYQEETTQFLRTPLLVNKIPRAHGGCLGIGSRRRTRQAAIISGEGHSPLDPEVSEWGNPPRVMPGYPRLNQIGRERTTGGTETSKYPEEEKSNEIARVAASESAAAQTHVRVSAGRCHVGVAGAGPARPVRAARLQRDEVAERHGRAGRRG